jgi:D-3-phosphoglycerate dehydrogenase
MFSILIAEPTHEILKELLEKKGYRCVLKTGISFSELKNEILNYEGLIIRSKFKIDREFIDTAKNLKFIARAGSGMENIDVEHAEKKGIFCINSPEGNRDSVGEHTIGMILALLHKINSANNEVKNGIWSRKSNIGNELGEKTIGILGYGNMGSAVAQRLKCFNSNVISYDKYKINYSNEYVKEVNYDDFFRKTEILSIHIPLNTETKYMINDSYIKKFENKIIIINTSRGNVLKTSDLVQHMKSGKIIAAGLDVLEYEETHFESILSESKNDDFSYLAKSENTILTPHIAGSSQASYRKIAQVLAQKIIDQFDC